MIGSIVDELSEVTLGRDSTRGTGDMGGGKATRGTGAVIGGESEVGRTILASSE